MPMHDGHRQRIKARFRTEGLKNFDEVHVLELLLCYCVPRKDINPLAHRLLEHFGSLTRVLDAPVEELEKVEGIGANISTFLSLTNAVGRYYQEKKKKQNKILNNINEYGDYLLSCFSSARNELVYILCMDAKGKVLCCREVGEGNVNSASISARKIVEIALSVNATMVVLAHNHPSGIALPSKEDISTTWGIAKALRFVDVHLADHIVVADGDYVSMVQSGCYRPWELNEEKSAQ